MQVRGNVFGCAKDVDMECCLQHCRINIWMPVLVKITLRTESPLIFLDKSSSFPTHLGKIEATLLAG